MCTFLLKVLLFPSGLEVFGMVTQLQADAAGPSEGRLVGAWPELWPITSVMWH